MDQYKKIVMAVDPEEEDLKPNLQSLMELQNWLVRENAHLEMVYVSRNTQKAQMLLDSYVSSLGVAGKVRTKVIEEHSRSRRKAAHTLVEYAQREASDFIVLTASGRKWFGRLVLGGFADALLAESPIPVLFLGSRLQPKSMTHSILFPTDFSPASRKAFETLLDQFKGLSPEVIVFHLVSLSTYWVTSFETNPFPTGYWEEQIRNAQEAGAKWVQYAERRGVSARLVVDPNSLSISEAIEQEAEQSQVGLIALASSSGRIRSRILGSVASELFSQRTYPVWVCGPEATQDVDKDDELRPPTKSNNIFSVERWDA